MEIGGGAAGGGPAAAPAPACHGQSSLLGVKAGSGPAPGAPQDESKSLGLAAPGLAGAQGRSGHVAPKSCARCWGAGRCKISEALRFKADDLEPALSSS